MPCFGPDSCRAPIPLDAALIVVPQLRGSALIHLLLDVPQRVLPFFLLVAAGVTLARLRLFDARMSSGLSTYVYWIGFPALLLHSLSRVGAPDRALALGLAAYGACALLVVVLMAALGGALHWTREERAGGSLSASLGNSAFLGLPIAAAVLGPEAARLSAGAVAVDFVVVAAVGVGLLGWAGGRSTWRSLMQALRNPIVLAAMTGSAMALLGLSLPGVLDRAVGAAAASGSPVALVALGVALGLTGLPTAGVPCEPVEEEPRRSRAGRRSSSPPSASCWCCRCWSGSPPTWWTPPGLPPGRHPAGRHPHGGQRLHPDQGLQRVRARRGRGSWP